VIAEHTSDLSAVDFWPASSENRCFQSPSATSSFKPEFHRRICATDDLWHRCPNNARRTCAVNVSGAISSRERVGRLHNRLNNWKASGVMQENGPTFIALAEDRIRAQGARMSRWTCLIRTARFMCAVAEASQHNGRGVAAGSSRCPLSHMYEFSRRR
jgi:hypothetical protein